MGAFVVSCVLSFAATEVAQITVGQDAGDFVGNDQTAIQQAIDAAAAKGGGEVVVAKGEYTVYNSVMLKSNVTLRGQDGVMFTKSPGLSMKVTSDCGFGWDHVKVAEPERWQVGWGVTLKDDLNAGGFNVNVRTIAAIEGDDLILDEDVSQDFCVFRNAHIDHSFPLIAAYRCANARVINITCDGNKGENELLDGCRGGAIYLFRSENCEVVNCVARNFHGDGISFQISPHTRVSRSICYGNTHLGLHPGSGSHHSTISHCEAYDNGDVGLFLCWRVAHSLFEYNEIHNNGGPGISIGHKDTDNLFIHNVIENNRGYGVLFRDEPDYNAGHRCTFKNNVVRNNSGKDGAAIWIDGATSGTRLYENIIANDRGENAPRTAIYIGAHASDVEAKGNNVAGFAELVRNESKAEDIRVAP